MNDELNDETNETSLSNVLSKLDAVKEMMSVKRVFGDAYEMDGASVIPVAAVRGGGGGGGGAGTGPDAQGSGTGGGVGFGVNARPVGAYVVKNGVVTWVPSVDVTRIVFAGLAVAAMLVFSFRRRRHGHGKH
jgi:uncharacterized spore protein YtfJ